MATFFGYPNSTGGIYTNDISGVIAYLGSLNPALATEQAISAEDPAFLSPFQRAANTGQPLYIPYGTDLTDINVLTELGISFILGPNGIEPDYPPGSVIFY